MTLDQAIRELRARSQQVPILPRAPSAVEVDAMERHLEVQFHPDYRRFLLEASDVVVGTVEPATITNPQSHTYLPDVVESARIYGVPNDLLPICEANGDFYCITSQGRIRFWSSDGAVNEQWSSLADWIEQVWIHEPA